MIRALFLTLLMAPAMASAQGAEETLGAREADHKVMDSCIAALPSWDEIATCIGAASDICMDIDPAGHTTLGMFECLSREFNWWDGLLNRNYQALNEWMDDDLFVLLRDAQRNWLRWRDAHCAFERDLWRGGTMAQPAFMQCMRDETARRAISFSEYLEPN